MKLVLRLSLIIINICFSETNTLACNQNIIIGEVAKIHGPDWKAIMPPCNKEKIKGYLQKIIQHPSQILKVYSQEHQSFIYKNALNSYGHFGTNNDDVNFVSGLYHDPHKDMQKYFGESSKFVKIVVLESLANTGSLEALSIYQKILEHEDSPLFMQKNAADFALWILDGVPKEYLNNKEGSNVYSVGFYPNILSNASTRFANQEDKLLELEDRKIQLKKVTELLLQSEKHEQIFSSLKALKESLDKDQKELGLSSPSTNLDTNFREPKSIKVDKHKLKDISQDSIRRNPSEFRNTTKTYFSTYGIFSICLLVLLTIVVSFIVYKKRDSHKK